MFARWGVAIAVMMVAFVGPPVLLEPERLLGEADVGAAGTNVPVRWDQGR